jgi:hypothetical protein
MLAVKPEEVRFIALYQSKQLFGEQSSGIRLYGRVASLEIVNRGDIWEIPPRSPYGGEERYCRFAIESWELLQNPVKAAGLTPGVSMMTSLFLLTHCRRVPELFLRTEESWELYSRLRAAAVRTYRSGGSELLETANDSTVMIAGQTIGAYHTDGYYEEYNLRDFLYNPHAFMQQMLLLFGYEEQKT